MKLKIMSFPDAGDLQKERVVMKAEADLDIGQYAAFLTNLQDGSASSGRQTAFWFPDGDVKLNDFVVLYSKHGKESTKVISGTRTAHFFYWGYDTAQWVPDGTNGLVVLKVSEWIKGSPETKIS